ncbi:chromate transporter [Oribacterium sp. NK2B42]|uniref:chromate transporter n=1 Tax=Oribacterium sp. NK2B42 TaxID=689781 RepID=UPI0003FAD7D6|nr:chromate transporter [Oribacterium sp. NK2B42]
MIYLELLLGFLQIGIFAFGGAYGAIPLIRDVVMNYGWISEDQLTYMIAVSESTPGPIMVNMATYIGSSQAGISGALIATTAVALPSFIIILIVSTILKNFTDNPHFQAVLKGIKPCIIGIIISTGLYMIINNCRSVDGLSYVNILITLILFMFMLLHKRFLKRKASPIHLIIFAAVLGIVFG